MAAPKNPYELGEKKGPDRPALAVPLTEGEQRAKLEGYVRVPREHWPFVPYSTHVRYIETAAKGGEFRSGGFVLKNPFDTKPRGSTEEKRFFKLQNNFYKANKDHMEWIVAYEDIEYLYVKGTGVELTLQSDLKEVVSTLNQNMQRLATYCKQLEARIAALEK